MSKNKVNDVGNWVALLIKETASGIKKKWGELSNLDQTEHEYEAHDKVQSPTS